MVIIGKQTDGTMKMVSDTSDGKTYIYHGELQVARDPTNEDAKKQNSFYSYVRKGGKTEIKSDFKFEFKKNPGESEPIKFGTYAKSEKTEDYDEGLEKYPIMFTRGKFGPGSDSKDGFKVCDERCYHKFGENQEDVLLGAVYSDVYSGKRTVTKFEDRTNDGTGFDREDETGKEVSKGCGGFAVYKSRPWYGQKKESTNLADQTDKNFDPTGDPFNSDYYLYGIPDWYPDGAMQILTRGWWFSPDIVFFIFLAVVAQVTQNWMSGYISKVLSSVIKQICSAVCLPIITICQMLFLGSPQKEGRYDKVAIGFGLLGVFTTALIFGMVPKPPKNKPEEKKKGDDKKEADDKKKA